MKADVWLSPKACILAWEIPGTEELGGLQSQASATGQSPPRGVPPAVVTGTALNATQGWASARGSAFLSSLFTALSVGEMAVQWRLSSGHAVTLFSSSQIF